MSYTMAMAYVFGSFAALWLAMRLLGDVLAWIGNRRYPDAPDDDGWS